MQEVFEKIVEKIKSDSSVKLYGSKNSGNYMIPVDVAIEIVKQEAEQYNNGWIPCSERLPEDGMDVLVWFEYFRYGNYNRLFRTIGISYTYNGQWSGFVNGSSGWRDLTIFAWQPMPPEYKESGERPKKTNFDRCCESVETMAQIIDIAKIGWTKDQIMEWLQKEECPVPD